MLRLFVLVLFAVLLSIAFSLSTLFFLQDNARRSAHVLQPRRDV